MRLSTFGELKAVCGTVQKQNFWDHRLKLLHGGFGMYLSYRSKWNFGSTYTVMILKNFWCKWSWIMSLMENLWEIHTSVLKRKFFLFLDYILKIPVPVCSAVLSIISSELWALRICYKELKAGYPLCIQFEWIVAEIIYIYKDDV